MSIRILSRAVVRSQLLAGLALAAPCGYAQTVAQAGAPPESSAANEAGAAQQPVAIQEVIVTARKRSENIQNVPVAVTALSGAELERNAITSIEKIAAQTPQLQVVRGSSGSGADLSLRGIGSTFTSIGIEQSVAVDVDGVYYGQGRIINEGFFDMKQVEILKGPQSLFFGKNASAGVVSFTSADPRSKYEALGRIGYEEAARESIFEGVLSGPINDKLGLRLAIRGSNQTGGYVQNLAPTVDYNTLDINTGASTTHVSPAGRKDVPAEGDLVGRLTAKYTPTDNFTVTLKASADRYRVTDATWNQELIYCPGRPAEAAGPTDPGVPSGTPQTNPGKEACGQNDWKIQNNNVPADIAATNPILGRHGGMLYQDYDSYAFTGNEVYTLPEVTFSAVTGYHSFTNYFLGDYDVTGAADGGTWGAERSQYSAFSTELRAQTSFKSPLNFMQGIYYQNTRLDYNQEVLFPGGLSDPKAADPTQQFVTLEKLSRTDGNTFAGFGQAIWTFSPQWELTAGARYTHETKNSYFRQPYVVAPYQAVFVQYDPAKPNTQIAAQQSFNNLAPETTLTWKPTSDVTVYGGYKYGYKSGGFSGSALYSASTKPGDLQFNPEKAKGFEGGIKSSWLDRRLQANLDLFSYRYNDFQVDYFDSVHINYITTNVGTASTRGAEAELHWSPESVRGLSLGGTVAYDFAHYSSFFEAPCYGGQTPDQGCHVATDAQHAGQTVQNLTGVATQNSPRWVAAFQAGYDRPLGGYLIGGASFNARYNGGALLSAFGNQLNRQGAYSIFDASLRLGSNDDRWEVAVIAKNLANRFAVTYMQDVPSSGGNTGTAGGYPSDQLGTPVTPRTVQFQLTARY